ncbi:MAG: NCS2 family permease [Treponema sp.]|nr:NCS2 family permease [Treponema sp.]
MEKLFKLKENGTTVQREIVAGITTFLAMTYILAVNPGMLSQAGMPAAGVFTATALSAGIATLVMAFAANLPVALAPGMGLNAFFTYSVVLGMGCSWQLALTAVFFEGILFIILSLCNVREAIVNAIPINLKKAISVGIGLFIALIGFANAGIVSSDTGTIIGFVTIKGGAPLLAVIGLAVTAILYCLKVPGAILLGIVITTVVGIPMGVTIVPEGFSPFATPAAPIWFQFDFSQVLTFKFFTIFFTFLFVDFFDTIGTLVGVTTQAGLVGKDGKIPRVKAALTSDAIGTVAGAMLGTSTVTSFVESTSGVAAGGRTGLTSVATGVMFLLSLFIAPLFLLVPSAATAPALIMVGFFMMRSVVTIDFEDPTEGIPAFVVIATMVFAYSIAEGIVWGIISYALLKIVTGKTKNVPIVTWILAVIFLLRYIFK